jgi:hypothetical protein
VLLVRLWVATAPAPAGAVGLVVSTLTTTDVTS